MYEVSSTATMKLPLRRTLVRSEILLNNSWERWKM